MATSLKVLEISIDLSHPGATPHAIEVAAAKLPNSAKFLGTCASQSSVYVFFEVQSTGSGGGGGGGGDGH